MRKALPLFLVLCLAWAGQLLAQGRVVSGQVFDASDNSPLIGVNVLIKGSAQGTVTDMDGRFKLQASDEKTLVFSYIGYQPAEQKVGSQSVFKVMLTSEDEQLDEVVVTAFGIEKSKKDVTFAVADVKAEGLAENRNMNIANSLGGRITGVQVTGSASGPGGASRVVIRGNSSLGANNQPLYIIDGVPMTNDNLGSAGEWGGIDTGDGISSLNPDDIESMSVLKGPAATALYGSRAQNGVIMISTKKGMGKKKGLGVEFNSNTTFSQVYDVFGDAQNEYGHGRRGVLPTTMDALLSTGTGSWGPKMEGQQALFFDGNMHAYSPNDYSEFFNTSYTTTNTVAFGSSGEKGSYRVSVSDMRHGGIIPNSSMSKNTINVSASTKLSDRLSTDFKVNYINEQATNRVRGSNDPGNPMLQLLKTPRSLQLGLLEANMYDVDGLHKPWVNDAYTPNPYWLVNAMENEDAKDRVIGYVSMAYKLTDWLTLQGRAGTDFYNMKTKYVYPVSTPWVNRGEMEQMSHSARENNYDLLAIFNKKFNNSWTLSGTAGANVMYRRNERIGYVGRDFSIPGFHEIGNALRTETRRSFSEKMMQSVFASAQVNYQSFLYLEVTGRNDWSSTLPQGNNSYFYPSVSTSFIWSELVPEMPTWFNYGKMRASWAQVGGDTDPYQLMLYYDMVNVGHPSEGGSNRPVGGLWENTIPPMDLQPSRTNSFEVGMDFGFLNNRLTFEGTYYNNLTSNQILGIDVSETSGFSKMMLNAGSIRNKGIELAVNATPIKTKDFSWDMTFNYTRNRNVVESLEDGVNAIRVGGVGGAVIEARPGQPYGLIVGKDFKRDDAGNIIHDASGYPMIDQNPKVLGNITPDWIGGFINSFKYKNWTMNVMIDIKKGGDIYSYTNNMTYHYGLNPETLQGRENGLQFSGVNEKGEVQDFSIAKEDVRDYWRRYSQNHSTGVQDATYIRLRELSIRYDIPKKWFAKTPIQGVSISAVGNNLFYLYNNVPNIDPDASINASNGGQGMEFGALPKMRSYGFNLNVKF